MTFVIENARVCIEMTFVLENALAYHKYRIQNQSHHPVFPKIHFIFCLDFEVFTVATSM
jgi:hypothetical protein